MPFPNKKHLLWLFVIFTKRDLFPHPMFVQLEK